MFRFPVLVVLVMGLLAGCSGEPEWRTSKLDSDFPRLDFELVSHDGDTLTEAQLSGSVTLLFFGYMSCPDACPATMARLSAVIEDLPESGRNDLRVLFVSVDPARDTPDRLANYAAHYGPQFVGATAEVDQLRQMANRYGSSFEYGDREGRDNYHVAHGSNVLAFDRDGQARLLIRSDDSLEAISHDVRRLLSL